MLSLTRQFSYSQLADSIDTPEPSLDSPPLSLNSLSGSKLTRDTAAALRREPCSPAMLHNPASRGAPAVLSELRSAQGAQPAG